MASEIFKEQVLGNFKPERMGMSAKHCTLIRQCPCAACLVEPAGTIHHLKSGAAKDERGMAMRSTDKWGVPLCPKHHMQIEEAGSRNERQIFLGWGVDPHVLAKRLWDATGDLVRMIKIVKEATL